MTQCCCFLGTFTYIAKSRYRFAMSVHLSTHISVTPTGWIFVNFDTGHIYENQLEKKKKFVLKKKRTKMSGT